MFGDLLIFAGIFAIGFGAGYGVREWKSRRRRRRSRPLVGDAEHSRFVIDREEFHMAANGPPFGPPLPSPLAEKSPAEQ